MRHTQKGGALLMMMLVMLIMITMLSLHGMQTSTMEIQMSKNFQDGVTTFVTAENGISESRSLLTYDQDIARPIVEDIIANGEVTLCDGAGLGTTGAACPDNTMGTSRYDVTLGNYSLYTPVGATTPTMRVFDITSIGTHINFARREVRIHALSPFMNLNTGAALSLHDTGNLNLNGNPLISGFDTSVPSNPNCNGGGCAGSPNPTGTDATGVYSEAVTNQIQNGIPVVEGAPAEQVGGATLDLAYWTEWAGSASAMADARNGEAWGTRDNPIVHVIDGDLAVMGNLDGFGVLIVNGANLAIGGNFHFEGIILVVADAAPASVTMGGTSRIFGSLVIVGPLADINYTGGGTPEIMYSSEALMQMNQNQSWVLRGWSSGS
jgi:hypothetical protein